MTKKQAQALMLKSYNATKRDGNVGWFYVNKASIDVYAAIPSEGARTCRITRKQLEMALRIMRAAHTSRPLQEKP